MYSILLFDTEDVSSVMLQETLRIFSKMYNSIDTGIHQYMKIVGRYMSNI